MNHPRLLLLLIGAATMAAVQAQDLRSCRGVPDVAARLACYDALPLPAPQAAPLVRPTLAAVVSGDAAFGLQGAARGEVSAVRSSVTGRFEGWGPKSRIRLDNGQLWEVVDDTSATVWLQNPQITVRRAALGSFMLEVDGMNRMARVRRVE